MAYGPSGDEAVNGFLGKYVLPGRLFGIQGLLSDAAGVVAKAWGRTG